MANDSTLLQRLRDAQSTIGALQGELTETNHGLIALTMELERRVAERTAQVDERTAQLEAANQELTRLYEQTKELDQVKMRFFANVSHELRTPLALILGPTENLLASAHLTASDRHTLAVVVRNARTLLRHVNDLLDISKLEAGKMEVAYTQDDLAHLLRVTAGQFETLAAERNVSLAVDAPRVVSAQVDVAKMQRVLVNLLSNAFRFVPPGGRVRCTLRAAEGHARLSVADNGPGVPAERRDAIFEPFQQADDAAPHRSGGTGLGLAIAKEFVELHGGAIGVTEAPGGGALFEVTVPLAAPPDARVQAPDAIAGLPEDSLRQAIAEVHPPTMGADAGTDAPTATTQPLALVIEDNPDMNRFITEVLASQYRTASAYDGREGLEKAQALHPDVILADLMMPHMSGAQLVQAVRAVPELDSVPIALLTAKADDELRNRLLRSGAQDYLLKPFSPDELRARVGNLVAMKRVRDVLQHELASRVQSLEELAHEVTLRKQEAETANRAKDVFLSTAAHELKTPLSTVKGYLQLLAQWNSEDRAARVLAIVNQQCDRLTRLIEELLEVSRLALGRLELHRTRVDLRQLVAEVVERSQSLTTRHRLRVQVQATALVEADPGRMEQVLVNLLGNAIKFSPNGGAIEINVSVRDGHDRRELVVAIQDQGIGIPQEKQARLFEQFYQAHVGTSHDYGGMGVGLHLSREFVVRQGGQMWYTSEEGVGSTFAFCLPLVAEDSDA